ncbi:hypothetical protein B0H13DRAFT_2293236 [Mycena leptocephala]|nr:hypothetical protein B0H13DRAFT_2293236 [Mycena leptocephala]
MRDFKAAAASASSICTRSFSSLFNPSFTQDNSAILSFSGDTVSIFGAVGPNLGPFTIKSDGKTIGSFDASKQNYVAQKDLYHADDISAGDHTFEPHVRVRERFGSSSASASPGQKQMSMALEDGYIAASIGAACLIATWPNISPDKPAHSAKGSDQREHRCAAFTNPSGAISLQPVHSNVESETAHLLNPRTPVFELPRNQLGRKTRYSPPRVWKKSRRDGTCVGGSQLDRELILDKIAGCSVIRRASVRTPWATGSSKYSTWDPTCLAHWTYWRTGFVGLYRCCVCPYEAEETGSKTKLMRSVELCARNKGSNIFQGFWGVEWQNIRLAVVKKVG